MDVCVVLQKVSEVESVCAEKLRDTEAQLNTARREHTKAGTYLPYSTNTNVMVCI